MVAIPLSHPALADTRLESRPVEVASCRWAAASFAEEVSALFEAL